jgi:hypothetical protein
MLNITKLFGLLQRLDWRIVIAINRLLRKEYKMNPIEFTPELLVGLSHSIEPDFQLLPSRHDWYQA